MITRDGAKMSKSKGNVVSPASTSSEYGADTARCYILFIGPPDQDADWSDEGVEGVHRFLSRLWRLADRLEPSDGGIVQPQSPGGGGPRAGPQGATGRSTRSRRTWAPASRSTRRSAPVMELVNDCYRLIDGTDEASLRFAVATAGSLVFPFAPHVGTDVVDRADRRRVWEEPWPAVDPAMLERDIFELVCQVNGKVRDRVEAPSGEDEAVLIELARSAPNMVAHLEGKETVKEVVVPGRLVNIVVR